MSVRRVNLLSVELDEPLDEAGFRHVTASVGARLEAAAQRMAVSDRVRTDLIQTAAIVPDMPQRIDDGRTVRRIVLELSGADVPSGDLDGAGQSATGNRIEIRDAREAFRPVRHDGADGQLGLERPGFIGGPDT